MTRSLSIIVEGIELRGRCGVTAEERAVGQTLVVDVRLDPSRVAPGHSDDLDDTVDYSRVVDLVRERRGGRRVQAARAPRHGDLRRDLGRVRPGALEVAVTKIAPPPVPIPAARVEVVRTA